MMISPQYVKSQKIKLKEESNKKITQYFGPSSNKSLSKENNNFENSNTNENYINKENTQPLFELKSGKSKLRSFLSSEEMTPNISRENISIIYENFKKTKNIIELETIFLNILKNKITIYIDNKSPPSALNAEGSLILKNAYFWILFILLKVSKVGPVFQAETFFTLFENASECCEENKNILCDFFYDYIEANKFYEEITERIKSNLPKDILREINFSNLSKKAYKFSIKNYKFFEFDNLVIKSEKHRKPLGEIKFLNKVAVLTGISKDEHSKMSIKTLEIRSAVSFEIDKILFKFNKDRKINIKNLSGEIIHNQNSFIIIQQISHNILNFLNSKKDDEEIMKIISQTSFSIFPHDKVTKRISFINNFEQEASSLPKCTLRERDLQVTLLEKIERCRDIESSNAKNCSRSQSFDSIVDHHKKITRPIRNTFSDHNIDKSNEQHLIPDKNKTLKYISSTKRKSTVKYRSQTKANKSKKK